MLMNFMHSWLVFGHILNLQRFLLLGFLLRCSPSGWRFLSRSVAEVVGLQEGKLMLLTLE